MELRHLRYFVAVADAGTVSLAARRLHVSQPALSRQVRDLEQDLGTPLFDRVGRRLRLTRHGGELLSRCRRVLAEVESVTERARALGGSDSGLLRVGATPQFIEAALPGVLRRYRKVCPGIDVQIVEDGAEVLVRRVVDGELHIALNVGILRVEGLTMRPLYPMRVVAVVAPGHRLARRTRLEVTDLVGERVLILTRDFQSRALFEEACVAAGVQLTIALESRSPQSIVALAEAGEGIAVVPSVVRLPRGRVHAVGMVTDGAPLGHWVGAAWDPRRYLPRYAERFIEVLSAAMRAYPGHTLRATRELPRPR
jgi:DNA-binding transcriptional LysR family regulator